MNEQKAIGKKSFVLGYGEQGRYGYVVLSVVLNEEEGGVEFDYDKKSVSQKLNEEVLFVVKKYYPELVEEAKELKGTSCEVRLTILDVKEDDERVNDFERAFYFALDEALRKLGFPPPLFYEPPS